MTSQMTLVLTPLYFPILYFSFILLTQWNNSRMSSYICLPPADHKPLRVGPVFDWLVIIFPGSSPVPRTWGLPSKWLGCKLTPAPWAASGCSSAVRPAPQDADAPPSYPYASPWGAGSSWEGNIADTCQREAFQRKFYLLNPPGCLWWLQWQIHIVLPCIFLIQLLAGLFSCLKPWVCAIQVHMGSNNNPGGIWNCSPPRKQCDLGHQMPPGHVIDGKISSTQVSPLKT